MTIVIDPAVEAVRARIEQAIGTPEHDEPAFSAQMTGITTAIGEHIVRVVMMMGTPFPEAAVLGAAEIFGRQIQNIALATVRGEKTEVRQ
ncbi:MAG: hypothetical protein K2Z25_01955 [Beijerinckiaceae bacterium]|nr:hypothetical protein [Beijerinckiaceae bacterium]